jgi:DNA-directed RNA polymerase subunit RPC12/RpoP
MQVTILTCPIHCNNCNKQYSFIDIIPGMKLIFNWYNRHYVPCPYCNSLYMIVQKNKANHGSTVEGDDGKYILYDAVDGRRCVIV